MRGPFELHIDDGHGEATVTRDTRGLSFSRSAYGGDKGLTGVVRVRSGTFVDLGPGDTVRLDDRRTGEPLWTGEATHPGEQSGPGGDAYDLVALGGANRLQAAATPLGYVVRDMTEWVRSGNSTKGAQTSEDERGDENPTLDVSWNDNKVVGVNQVGEWIFRALKRAGLDVGYVFANTDAGLDSGNYVLRVMTGPTMDNLTSRGNHTASTTAGQLTASLTGGVVAGDRVVALRVLRNGSPRTATDDDWFQFFNVVVMQVRVDQYGTRDTSTYTGTVTASQAIKDMVGRGMCPGLDPDLVTVDSTTFGIDELAWLEGITMGDALDELLVFEPDLTWRVAGAAGTFTRFDFDNPRYVIGARHGGIEQPGSDDDVRCNEVLVTWTDRKGKERTTLVTAEVEGLTYRRSYLPGLQLPDGLGSEANAQRAGSQILEEMNRGPRAGRAVIREPIFDEWAGCMVHPSEILPGHVAMKQSTGELLKVTEMTYDDDDEATTLELDRPPRTPEQILARLKRRRRRRK